ncbi:AraC family transcriptional regulator [Saccharibacillus sp. CPCC 101409]|uniref:AraC family transcriptional regulator n=1 Tax=Saccharibacillus sp. CPCC 101409 TaxID=3058041 RepID=UPI002673DA0C|nr:AraC family transcriptional regulator [Saccharibacillus sp. CPCC 101409]MDO3411976.1 AraC family transcriptional regulator [Saccharibacillus sp. CPCC 101409]
MKEKDSAIQTMPDNGLEAKRSELARLIVKHTSVEGPQRTAIPSLNLIRADRPNGPTHSLYRPSLCIVVQGAKEVLVGRESFTYDPATYLVTSVELPIKGRVVQASPEQPYLSAQLYFTADQIVSAGGGAEQPGQGEPEASVLRRGVGVGRMDEMLLDSLLRLLRLLDTPDDIEALSPLMIRELLYRVTRGELGGQVRRFAAAGTLSQRIAGVVRRIQLDYAEPLRVDELAEQAHMSESSLYAHFKEVTNLTPIQYQKRIRLQEARRLLLSETSEAAEAAFRVGYESPSQFSREYSRMFGLPPARDMKRMREELAGG